MSVARVILIGLRAGGKSTVAAALAERLGAPMVDLDVRSAHKLGGSSAADVIRRYGLAAFRSAELGALEDVLVTSGPTVLALGGGTPTAPGADERLRAAGQLGWVTVYLHADVETLTDRLRQTDLSTRPALTPSVAGAGVTDAQQAVLDEVGSIYLRRDGLYRQLANLIVETGGRSPEQIAGDLAGVLTRAGAGL